MRPDLRASYKIKWEDSRPYRIAGAAVCLTLLAAVGVLVLLGVLPPKAFWIAPLAIVAAMVTVFLPLLWVEIMRACIDDARWRRRHRKAK